MQYLDVTRFMFSVPEPPTAYNSVVLQDDCYSLNSTGYPVDINVDTRITPDFSNIQYVTIRLDRYSFAIDQLWRDFDSIMHNSCLGLWLTVINLTAVNVYAQLFERVRPVKPVYLQIMDNAVLDTVKDYTELSIAETVCAGFELVDIHYQRLDGRTVFVPVVPAAESVVYNTVQPGVPMEF